mmetsp:Transcript_23815/g.55061  ORF Transcript_23815/g.55061 Transcript_23815/m.55061 type:complete len:110 (+) Transcript_23815:135-464(+)
MMMMTTILIYPLFSFTFFAETLCDDKPWARLQVDTRARSVKMHSVRWEIGGARTASPPKREIARGAHLTPPCIPPRLLRAQAFGDFMERVGVDFLKTFSASYAPAAVSA